MTVLSATLQSQNRNEFFNAQTFKNRALGTSLVIQWLSVCAFNAGGHRFNPWSGNRDLIYCTVRAKKKKKKCSSLPVRQIMCFQNNTFWKNSYNSCVKNNSAPSPSWYIGLYSCWIFGKDVCTSQWDKFGDIKSALLTSVERTKRRGVGDIPWISMKL